MQFCFHVRFNLLSASGPYLTDIHHLFLPFQTTFILVFAMISSGFIIRIFIKYNINYTMIFELDLIWRFKDIHMFKIGIIYLFVWSTLFLTQVLIVKYVESTEVKHVGIPAFVVFTFFFLLPFLPFRLLWANVRFSIIDDLWNIAIAPIGKLWFMQFFIADVMCSMVRPFMEFP